MASNISEYNKCTFRKNEFGEVSFVLSSVKSSGDYSHTEVVAQLTEGFRPLYDIMLTATVFKGTEQSAQSVIVHTNGQISIWLNGNYNSTVVFGFGFFVAKLN